MNVNPIRSVGARLSLALLLVVAGSLTLVYIVVIPSLESRLIDSKINQLRSNIPTLLQPNGIYAQDIGTREFATDASDAVAARVVVYNIFSTQPLTLSSQQDSTGYPTAADVENDPIALRTANSGNVRRKYLRAQRNVYPAARAG